MSKCILIVDDEEDVRALIQLGLEMKTDWQILNASSGSEALSIVASKKPDVILLDLMMPGMDGRETLQKFQNDPITKHIPVILMSAKVKSVVEEDLSDLDVAAIFTKPLRPLNIAEQIIAVLGE